MQDNCLLLDNCCNYESKMHDFGFVGDSCPLSDHCSCCGFSDRSWCNSSHKLTDYLGLVYETEGRKGEFVFTDFDDSDFYYLISKQHLVRHNLKTGRSVSFTDAQSFVNAVLDSKSA